MIRALIIDDEPIARQNLKELLAGHFPDISLQGEANNMVSGLQLLRTTPADVLFLDIHLTDGTGFELLDQFRPTACHILFTTAHDEFALRAFRYHAFDYLLKPIAPDELRSAVERIRTQMSPLQTNTQQLNALLQDLKSKTFQTITLSTQEGLHILPLDQIIRLQSTANYTTFFTRDKEKIMVARTIKEYEDLLPSEQFLRIHRSHIINLTYIKSIMKEEGGYVLMRDNNKLPIARRKKDILLEYFKNKSLR